MNEVTILDGAMGTQLIALGLEAGQPSVIWNAENPTAVRGVHKSYADAGSNFLITNTFGGSAVMLDRCGWAGRLEELNRSAVALARDASEARCRILGDIGPCGEFLEPFGELTERSLADAVKLQAQVLADCGVDGFIVETMSDPNEMQVTVSTAKRLGLPVYATFTYERGACGFQTMMGTSPAEATRLACEAGADAVGANCGTSLSLDDYLELAKVILASAAGLPVLLQPNAGTPVDTGAGFTYALSDKAFADWARRAAALGVAIIGGCCGTAPAHIAAARAALGCDDAT